MDYRNLESLQATLDSYWQALDKMREYAIDFEPSCNEFNSRTVLPTHWRPVEQYDRDKLRKDANHLFATHANLVDFGKARYLAKGYWDYDAYFKVSWQLQIPFDIYVWECGTTSYPDGFDEDGKPLGKPLYTPARMVKWCSPQYLCLGEISNWATKSWALPDWKIKHQEIEIFMDDNPNLREQYRKAVQEADREINE